jgi:hypothetical protein
MTVEDKPPKARTMSVAGANLREGHPKLWGFLIGLGGDGDPTDQFDQMDWGITIAHELGHVLGLKHREPDPANLGPDGLTFPHDRNLMDINVHQIQAPENSDIDLIQVITVHSSYVFAP